MFSKNKKIETNSAMVWTYIDCPLYICSGLDSVSCFHVHFISVYKKQKNWNKCFIRHGVEIYWLPLVYLQWFRQCVTFPCTFYKCFQKKTKNRNKCFIRNGLEIYWLPLLYLQWFRHCVIFPCTFYKCFQKNKTKLYICSGLDSASCFHLHFTRNSLEIYWLPLVYLQWFRQCVMFPMPGSTEVTGSRW